MAEERIAPDATTRFTGRAAVDSRYRPSYPRALLDLLSSAAGFASSTRVADMGSGTGILTRLFLENGNTVFAVEPNADMRAAAEESLSSFPGFHSVDGTAEHTSLPASHVELITAGQSFHWFSPSAAKKEFGRISANGTVAVIYNARAKSRSGFMTDYESLIKKYGRNFSPVRTAEEDNLNIFFSSYRLFTIPNPKQLDLYGLTGRLLSASYMPARGEKNHGEMLSSIRDVFERNQVGGKVTMEMTTEIYLGTI